MAGKMTMIATLVSLALFSGPGCLATDLTSGCGVEKQCFLVPEGCSGSACDYAVTFTGRDSYVDFVVGTNVEALGHDVYIAVGVGTGPAMDGGSVMDCVHFDNTLITQLSYNNGHLNEILPEDVSLEGLAMSSGQITDGFLECSFSRKADVSSDSTVLSLASPNQYYITVARGIASGQTVKEYHGADKVSSSSTYDFMASPTSAASLSPDATQALCGDTAGCFASPAGCSGSSCDYLVAYSAIGGDVIQFTASARIPADLGSDAYLAVGLGDQPQMDGSTVVDCIHYSGDMNFQFSYNQGYTNLLGVTQVNSVLTDMSGTLADQFLTCTYTRPIVVPNSPLFADLSDADTYYLIVAVGAASSDELKVYHAGNKVVSPTTIDFLSVVAPGGETPGPAIVPAGGDTIADEIQAMCGDVAGCYSSPDGCSGSTCDYIVAYTQIDDVIEFTATGRVPSDLGEDFYLTVAIGPQPLMDGSTVVDCIMYGGSANFQFSYNDGHSNAVAGTAVDGYLSDTDASLQDGFFTCKYRRPLVIPEFPEVPDLSIADQYHILMAMGLASSATAKEYHGTYRVASGSPVNFQEATTSSGVYISRMLKAHGGVMLVAWALLAGYGLMNSRYFKDTHAESKICGLDVWFWSHRTSFQACAALTIVGIIIIFSYMGGWSDLSTRTPSIVKAHPQIGIVVLALVLLNPVLAFFRPGKDGANRPLFNWVHRIIGTVAFILGMLNNGLGFLLLPVVSRLGLGCVVIFAAFHVLCELVLMALSFGCCGHGGDAESEPIIGKGGSLRQTLKKALFWLYTLGSLVLTVFMLIGLVEI